ncbi:Uncharacterised protein [Enterobacter cloacae]|nr:Uncharacterised protein [Enterobacter cloacae]
MNNAGWRFAYPAYKYCICRPGKRSATGQSRYSGNNPTKQRFLRGSDISSSSLSTHAR